MLPPGARIVGIQSVEFRPEDDRCVLRFVLSDGSVAATFWLISELPSFLSIVSEGHASLSASLQ